MAATAHTIDFASMIPPDLIEKTIANSTAQAVEGLRTGLVHAAPMFLPFVPLLAKLFAIALVIAIFDAFRGNWEMLGSLLNKFFRIALLVAVVGVFGLGILFSDYFEIILAVIGSVSFWLVGRIIRKFPRRNASF